MGSSKRATDQIQGDRQALVEYPIMVKVGVGVMVRVGDYLPIV